MAQTEDLIDKRRRATIKVGSHVLELEPDQEDDQGNLDYKIVLSHNFKNILFQNGEDRFIFMALPGFDGPASGGRKFYGRRIDHISGR